MIVGVLAFIIGVLTLLPPEPLGAPQPTPRGEAEALGSKPSKRGPDLGITDPEDGVEMIQSTNRQVKA